MTHSYNEQEGIAFQQDVINCYREANQTPDLLNVVWSNRMTYDAQNMGYPASRAKHLRELRTQLGLSLPSLPLEDLAHLRGALFTARLDLPYGPRPGQFDNVIQEVVVYEAADRDRATAALRARGYTHSPMGPCVDAGYHGQTPASDFRSHFTDYLDVAEGLQRAGLEPIHFLRPDRGCAGLDWTIDDLDRELTPLFSSDRAQQVMRLVCLGWEPGPRYFYDNAWWIAMCQWMARVFPDAYRAIHFVPDLDGPVGGTDDNVPGKGWPGVAPYIHAFFNQNAGYTDGSSEVPTEQFKHEFAIQFDPAVTGSFAHRFATGYAGWPTFSAWGQGKPIHVVAFEYASFANWWKNWNERYARELGDLALAHGAAGAMDGCGG